MNRQTPVPGDVSTPGHGQGEGPVGYKSFWRTADEKRTQETMGGAGVSEANGVPPAWESVNE